MITEIVLNPDGLDPVDLIRVREEQNDRCEETGYFIVEHIRQSRGARDIIDSWKIDVYDRNDHYEYIVQREELKDGIWTNLYQVHDTIVTAIVDLRRHLEKYPNNLFRLAKRPKRRDWIPIED